MTSTKTMIEQLGEAVAEQFFYSWDVSFIHYCNALREEGRLVVLSAADHTRLQALWTKHCAA